MEKLPLFLIIFILTSCSLRSQTIYKTPYGSKYHLASCRMVESVSEKVVDTKNTKLTPCLFCNPPALKNLKFNLTDSDKSKGRLTKTSQCKGIAKSTGKRCKHMTQIGNGYCFQHTSQNTNKVIPKSKKTNLTTKNNGYATICRAKTMSGNRCKNKVIDRGRCYLHS